VPRAVLAPGTRADVERARVDQRGQGRNRSRWRPGIRRLDGIPAWVYGVAGVFPVFVLGYLALAPLLNDHGDRLAVEGNVNGPCVPLVQPCPQDAAGTSTLPASAPTDSPTPTPTDTPSATDTPSP